MAQRWAAAVAPSDRSVAMPLHMVAMQDMLSVHSDTLVAMPSYMVAMPLMSDMLAAMPLHVVVKSDR